MAEPGSREGSKESRGSKEADPLEGIPRSASKMRSASKLKGMPLPERMMLQLPRTGLATDGQLEHLAKAYPAGGQTAMQALLNLMRSGVVDCVIWNRESWVGDSIGSVTGFNGDKLDLMDPVPMPPTGGCNLMLSEGVLEQMLNQLQASVKLNSDRTAVSTQPMEELAKNGSGVPRQVCMLVQRHRFTGEVQRCILDNRQLSIVSRAHSELKKKLGDWLLNKDLPEGERATLTALQQVLHEQSQILQTLSEIKNAADVWPAWLEHMRFYYDENDNTHLLKYGEKVVALGHEYSPPTMLITTPFIHMLRQSYLTAMAEDGTRLLVLVGAPGCGKTGMLKNVGQLLGMLPTTIRLFKQTTTDEAWWKRQILAHKTTGGGSLAPLILSQADRAPEAALEVAMRVAFESDVALCLTMSAGSSDGSRDTTAKTLKEGIFSEATIIDVPEAELKVIAAGQLAAEGLLESETLAAPLGGILESLREECSKQAHYDFGPRTLMQICTQIGVGRKKGQDEKDNISAVVERCTLPKLVQADVPILQRLLNDNFKVEKTLTSPSNAKDDAGRWHCVAENISSITKIEPDCIVLPVPEADESMFFEEFCKMLNRHGSALVRMPGKLSDMTPEELLGTMPKRGEEVKDGVLVQLLRKAMDDHVEPSQLVWVAIMTGNCSPEIWESLHELLNDSGSLNLATGEQLRLKENLRFLFVMAEAGDTSQDTFSRAAVVYTDPAPAK